MEEKYNNWSNTYDTDNNVTRDLDHSVVSQFIDQFKHKKIVEIGCGTGKNTILLSEVAKSVLAIDFSEGMLKIAKNKLKNKENITFQLADITEKWPCEEHSYDLVMCNLVMEHFRNLEFLFSEARRILLNSGEFFINEFHPYYQYQGKKANFVRNGQKIEIDSFIHDVSEFINAGLKANFDLRRIEEYRDNDNIDSIPRLISFTFSKKVSK